MAKLSHADVRLNYDPSAPQQRFREAKQPIVLTPSPVETDDLSRFKGYDAVVVTWTAAAAAALTALLTPLIQLVIGMVTGTA
jgi:hypothetical protein